MDDSSTGGTAPGDDRDERSTGGEGVAAADRAFEALLEHLLEARGFDFTGYKRASLRRRVDRRMRDIGIEGYEDYRDHLEAHPAEYAGLFTTVLINVTSFFRDAEAWTHLEERVLPDLLRRRPHGPLRFWSAGCASGEEAYSLAMVLVDALGAEDFRRRVKVYATDVDEEALAQGRLAAYDEHALSGVPEERRSRYFVESEGRWAFRKDLRRSVIFGRNDLVQDAPISRVDLLLCRNTLMYLNAETQERVLRRLHFALAPEGVLFLGRAEMLLSHGDLFAPLDLRRRFFRAVPGGGRREPVRLGEAGPGLPVSPDDPSAHLLRLAFTMGAEAQVVVEAGGHLVFSNARADVLFGMSSRDRGRSVGDLELSYRPLELRAYLDQVRDEHRSVRIRDVAWARPGDETSWYDVEVAPLLDEGGANLGTTVVIVDVTRQRALRSELEYANHQLETAYEELQSTNEELETTNEELQSTVEELETTNEELQSTNEELETMNEELQSTNEELAHGNAELHRRGAEVARLNDFMRSVLSGLRAGVAVLDRDGRVRLWNEHAEDLWGVRQDEVAGQPFLDLDIGLLAEHRRSEVRELLAVGAADGQADEAGAAVGAGAAAGDGGPRPAMARWLEAVNRRGRPVSLHLSVAPLADADGASGGAILVMDEHVDTAGQGRG